MTVGTNAIGTALAEQAPVQLFSAEHFEQQQHPWYCTAAPVHDPRTGELLGVVDVSGPALSLHPAITALVETAVRLAESLLWRHHQERLERLRSSVEHLLSGVRGPVLLVDDHGWVAHHSGIAVRDRIGVPRADRALAVPGMGLCLPERLADGWLVRPPGGGHALTARLDLTSRPVLEVRAEGDPWTISLSRRHAADPRAARPCRAGRPDRLRPEPLPVRRCRPRRHRARGGLAAAARHRGARRDEPLPPGRRRRADGRPLTDHRDLIGPSAPPRKVGRT